MSEPLVETALGLLPKAWPLRPLSELFEFRNGVNAEKASYGKGTRFINVLEVITQSHLTATDIPGRIELTRAQSESYAVQSGDILFNRTSETADEVGLASVYLDAEPVVFGGFVIRGRPRPGLQLDSKFAGFALRAPAVRKQVTIRGQGAIRANIGQSDLSRVLFPLPPLQEQEAIAAALDDLGAQLERVDQLIAKKEAIKQGAMHQLLTGQTRLPGFQRPWPTPTTIGAEFELQLGKMLDSERNTGTLKPYLGNRAVQWGRIDVSTLEHVRLTNSDLSRYRLARGDLLVCEGGEIGRAAIWDAPIEECYYQKALHRLRPRACYAPSLLLQYLRLWATHGLLTPYVTQTSIAHLPREKLVIIPLPRPPADEQRAIVEVLTDMDDELEALKARRDKTQALKQGMMQELLSGRIRLV